MLYTFNDAGAPERHDLQYFEMFGNRGIYHQGWSAVTKHKTPWVMVGGDDAGVRRRRVGALRRRTATTARPATSRPSSPTAGQAAAAVAHRGHQVQRAAARRPRRRAAQPRARRTADAHPRQLPAVLPRHGPAVGEQRRQHQEQVVLGHRRGRGARRRGRGRDHRPGRPLRRLGRLRQGRQAEVRLQRARHPGVRHRRPTAPIPAGTHQVRMEFAYDGGGLAKGGDVTLFHDGTPGRQGPGRGHPADDLLGRRDHRHRLRVRHHRHPRLHRPRAAGSPARSTGCSSTSATTTTTTSSTPRSDSGSPWPGSDRRPQAARPVRRPPGLRPRRVTGGAGQLVPMWTNPSDTPQHPYVCSRLANHLQAS